MYNVVKYWVLAFLLHRPWLGAKLHVPCHVFVLGLHFSTLEFDHGSLAVKYFVLNLVQFVAFCTVIPHGIAWLVPVSNGSRIFMPHSGVQFPSLSFILSLHHFS